MPSTSKDAQRFIVVSDNHGDMADAASVGALWSFMKDWKPEIRVHAGDNYDFRNLRKGASDEEKAASLADDWEAGNDFLRRFFDGGASNHFLRGNHDERLYEFRNSCSGMLRDYATDGIKQMEAVVKKCRAKMLPYDSDLGVLDLGKLSVLHGFHAGVGACRLHAAIYGNAIFGHVHTIETASVASREPAEARSIGCLCKRDMDYVNKKTGKLRWAQGWAYGLLFPDGTYQLFQTRNIGGQFYAATEIKTFAA
jgi:predicted phosphodiesterase